MENSVLLQKQIRDNSEALDNALLDMQSWEKQMKHVDEQLRKEATGEATLPPIRNKAQKQHRESDKKQINSAAQPKRIKSNDYCSWDKFNVEKACRELDKKEASDESDIEETMTEEEYIQAYSIATQYKNEGNVFVQKQEWAKAIGCYNQAIKLFPYDAVFYANNALCHLKLDNLHSAESNCSAALALDEQYVKAYHRRASAWIGLKQYMKAKEDLDKILKIEPNNKDAKSLLATVEKNIKSSKPVAISGENLSNDIPIEKRIAEKLCPSVKENKQEKVTDKDNNEGIPDWLPEKDNVAIVEPIKKPAHLRSNKAGVKILVTEVAFETAENIEQADKPVANTKPKLEEKPITEIEETETCVSEEKVTEVSEVLTNPKTAVQFLRHWKECNSPEYRFKYLKQLPPGIIPAIFQCSMEPDILSDILSVLKTEFVPKGEPVLRYLEDLSKVKRFKALVMFISNEEKEGLRSLFHYCKASEVGSEEKVQNLYQQYEL